MIKKITPAELTPGMYVCGMEKTAGKPLFFMNNILLKTQEDADRMACNGYASVYISVEEAPGSPAIEAAPLPAGPETPGESGPLADKDEPIELEDLFVPLGEEPSEEAPESPSPAWAALPEAAVEASAHAVAELAEQDAPGKTPPLAETSFDAEIREAHKVRGEAEQLVREFLQDARLGRQTDTVKVGATVGRMVDSVFRNMDALTSLARLKSFDDYTFSHCVNVSILSITLGRHMGLERPELEELGTGAILHDIGKMLVPEKILNKPGRLTDDEFTVIKRHPEYGKEVLTSSTIREGAMLIATQHHERYDGSGYSKGLARDDIHPYARIAAVADVYDAMTSNRVYQNGMAPEEALKRLYLMRGTHFEPHIVERLIKCLGIYPIGTFVELNTGELAVVKMVNRSHPMQPRVEILTDRDKRPCKSAFEADLKDEVGRWVVATRKPEEFAHFQQTAAS